MRTLTVFARSDQSCPNRGPHSSATPITTWVQVSYFRNVEATCGRAGGLRSSRWIEPCTFLSGQTNTDRAEMAAGYSVARHADLGTRNSGIPCGESASTTGTTEASGR
jgi:hypothetical protein